MRSRCTPGSVKGFIDALGLRNLILVGDDWGGPLATHYAVGQRENVRGLVLLETFLWPMTWKDDSHRSSGCPSG